MLLHIKSFLEGQQFASAEEITEEAIQALTGMERWFPRMLPKAS
jgi:hypothetical protein